MSEGEVSPSTSNSTNKGGRPREWTEPRIRRLIRLYLYTSIDLENEILPVISESSWEAKKEAAHKHLKTCLGTQPRWTRPKSADERGKRMDALMKSCRGFKRGQQSTHGTRNPEDPGASEAKPRVSDLLDAATTSRRLDQSAAPNSAISASGEAGVADAGPSAHYNQPWTAGIGPQTDRRTSQSGPRTVTRSLVRFGVSRRDTGLTGFTGSSGISMTSSFCRKVNANPKLSARPMPELKDVFRVLKRFTFPKDSGSDSPSFSPNPSSFSLQRVATGFTQQNGPSLNSPIVPSDFINHDLIKTQGQCYECSKRYDAFCGCKIESELRPACNLWPTRGSCHVDGTNYPWDLSDFNLTTRDDFDNTAFHFLATRPELQAKLFDLVANALDQPGSLPIGAKNTAGQTFLHVLHPCWYEEGSYLRELLMRLRKASFDVLATDVYGRNFFHLLRKSGVSADLIKEFASPYDAKISNRRDAFGNKPIPGGNLARVSRRIVSIRRLSTASTSRGPALTVDPSSAMLEPQTRLLEVINRSLGATNTDRSVVPDPFMEDVQGRNALHCLAEVDLNKAPGAEKQPRTSPSQKRKRGKIDIESELEDGLLKLRAESLGTVLQAQVDVNHYNLKGQTPLMSFITHAPDQTTQEQIYSKVIIKILLERGANIEARNRQGETALYLAARLGKRIAVRELLGHEANFHVRDVNGVGILQLIDNLYETSEVDNDLNSRLESCRAIITGRFTATKVEQNPSAIDEWGCAGAAHST